MTFRVAVTGANGFVGRNFVRYASALGHEVVGVVRDEAAARSVIADGGLPKVAPELVAEALRPALEGCRALVHLAHIGSERPGATYEGVNVRGTEAVATAARECGVARVVVFSGLGVAHYGQKARCTNRYFLSKLEAEVALYRSGLEVVVFRPSYLVGPGNSFVAGVLRELATGAVEQPGDGSFRMQPLAVRDAVALVGAALERPAVPNVHHGGPAPLVYDLVGPEPISYRGFLERLARVARAAGKPAELRIREVPLAEADAQARAGGWHGMPPDELDCVLCDEVSDPAPLEALLGRFLTPLDEALAAAVRGTPLSTP
ncbi:MAG TPA: NAD-dependent epimerase/dehydratase family protein [Vicinamibacteria bacterium]|nr:NAD-dependent epimerase/dehydratase family protein [Vicinamibacteria bacterium]